MLITRSRGRAVTFGRAEIFQESQGHIVQHKEEKISRNMLVIKGLQPMFLFNVHDLFIA